MINKIFAYHKPSQNGLDKITKLREAYTQLSNTLHEVCPTGTRERAIAMTELETSAMWAVKSVVFNDPTSEI